MYLKQNSIGLLLVFSIFFSSSFALCADREIPGEIAGIVLGSDFKAYPDIIESNFMKEVVVTDWHGFRKGVISYGICLRKDKILKIDMKYEDKSKSFYKQLLKRFKQKFGEPNTWAGDSFGNKFIWKWSFVDDSGTRVSMKLQHNGKDSNETIGNMIKLSYPQKMNEERECFMEMCEEENQNLTPERREVRNKTDWSYLIPQ
jgi:hypothetical protein